MIKSLNLRELFFPNPTKYIPTDQGIEQIARSDRRAIWVVPRADLRHFLIDLPAGLTRGQREKALRLQLSKKSPYEDFDFAAHWHEGRASCYVWHRGQVGSAIDALNASNITPVPEPFMVARPDIEDGVCLVRRVRGVECLIIRNGIISASRWWGDTPSAAKLDQFLRAEGEAGVEVSENGQMPWLDNPWHLDQTRQISDAARVSPKSVAAVGAGLLLIVFCFQLGQIAYSLSQLSALKDEIADLDDGSLEIRRARGETFAERNRVEALIGLYPYPEQLDVLAGVSGVAAPFQASIVQWKYGNGRLEFSMAPGKQDVPAPLVIRMLESNPIFSDVSTRTMERTGELEFQLSIVPSNGGAVR